MTLQTPSLLSKLKVIGRLAYLAWCGPLNDRVIHAQAFRLLWGVCIQVEGVCKHCGIGKILDFLISAIDQP
jgi:hypothetical protein